MAIKLNLLPPERAVSGGLGKILKAIRSLNVILLAGFIIFAVGLGAFFLFSYFELRGSSANVDQLKSQIVAQETSEQQIVLLKDRLAKIKVVQGLTSSAKNLDNVDPLITGIGPSSSLSEFDVDPQKVGLSVLFRTNSDFTNFLQNITGSVVFKTVVLSSFGFNPASGYLATFSIL